MTRAALAPLFLAVALGLVPGAGARTADHPRLSFTAADTAAARAAVVRKADLGSTGWTGGARKPDLSTTMNCPGYAPKQSDLVVTGAAETVFQNTGIAVQSAAQVLKTRAMVARDWQRTVTDPKAFGCMRTMMSRSLPSSQRLVSFTRLPFPHVARLAAAFRAVIEVSAGGRHAQVVADVVVVGRSRTELTLSVEAPVAAKGSLPAAETRLMKRMLARVRA